MTKRKALSVRLAAIAAMVKPGSRIADIGTDHAYLPVELVQSGTAAHALAMDIREGPLKSARRHVEEAGLSGQIDLRLSDGLAGLVPGEADTVILAGMGGDLIMRILAEGRGALYGVDTLILSPHTKIPQVRGMLPAIGYAVDCEDMVCDAGKYYVIIRAVRADAAAREGEDRFDTGAKPPAAASAYCGEYLLTHKHPVLYDWLRREEDTQERILSGLREKSASAAREMEIRENLIAIRQALAYYAVSAKESAAYTVGGAP